MPRKPNTELPRCLAHPNSSVRAQGMYGDPPRVRLRCFYKDEEDEPQKHGFRPPSAGAPAWGALPGGRYSVEDVTGALVDIARGSSYTDAARRVQLARGRARARAHGVETDAAPTAVDGRLVATWVDKFAGIIIEGHEEKAWPATVVLDSTEFSWTNPRTGTKEQMFTVLGAWGYPAGAKRGRLWALCAAPTDSASAWEDVLRSMPGVPELVVYDSDKGVAAAVPKVWPTANIHLCEHHLYTNARKWLRADGQGEWGNLYGDLLARAGQSVTGWSVFRNAVLADPRLVKTGLWVLHWDQQMTGQTARRPTMPPHYSTGALDPQFALIRQTLKPRAWTYRNLARMNHLLGLTRLRVNLRDTPSEWASLIAKDLAAHVTERSNLPSFDEPAAIAPSGYRTFSLRMHAVPPSAK